MKRWIKYISLTVMTLGILFTASFYQAKKVADDLVSPVKSDVGLYVEDVTYKPLLFHDENYVSIWIVRYDWDDGSFHEPVDIYISAFGDVVLTNPGDLEDIIKRRADRIKSKNDPNAQGSVD